MRKLIAILTVITLCAAACASPKTDGVSYSKEQVKALLKEMPERASNLHHFYEVPKISDTKAPSGYEPFYVSHFGRHGCRYHTSSSPYETALGYLKKLDSLDQLTNYGKGLLEAVESLKYTQRGMDGMLTQKGGQTHRGIATRLAGRYPQIFNQSDRNDVRAFSSTVQRCIMSMSNFILGLEKAAPGLDISMDTGARYMDYIAHSSSGAPANRGGQIRDSMFKALFNPDRICKLLFKDPKAPAKIFKDKEYNFYYSVINAGDIAQCLDTEVPNFYSELNLDELYAFWAANDIGTVNNMGRTRENGGYRERVVGGPILNDILNKAQDAIDGGKVCADFRFGHDSGIMPFLFLIRLNGFDETYSCAEAPSKWLCFKEVPMAANVQFVFFRNKQGSILVKVLLNECERTFPALEAVNGVYYKWPVLRDYLQAIADGKNK